MVVHTCNLGILEARIGKLLQIQGQLRLHSEYQTRQGFKAKSCLSNKNNHLL